MHDELYMSSSTSLAALIRDETISDLRTLAFYNIQISALEKRMNLTITPHFTDLPDAQDRLTDLTRAAEHILAFNECYDALWEQMHFTDELLEDSNVIMIDDTPLPCPDRPTALNNVLKLPALPHENYCESYSTAPTQSTTTSSSSLQIPAHHTLIRHRATRDSRTSRGSPIFPVFVLAKLRVDAMRE